MTIFICLLLVSLLLYLFIDYNKVRIIKFLPQGEVYWRIAFDEQELFTILNGRLAEVIMPEKPLIVRVYRYIFPLKSEEMTCGD